MKRQRLIDADSRAGDLWSRILAERSERRRQRAARREELRKLDPEERVLLLLEMGDAVTETVQALSVTMRALADQRVDLAEAMEIEREAREAVTEWAEVRSVFAEAMRD